LPLLPSHNNAAHKQDSITEDTITQKWPLKSCFAFSLLYCLLLGEFAKQTATAISEKFPMQFKFKLRGSTAAWFSRVFPSNIGRS